MKQALHIFRKDVRQLWLPITIVFLLVAAHAVFDVLRSPLNTPETARINQTASLLSTALVLAWWYLIAVVIYQEPLPGDRQFWVTRPYSWKSLLGAKLLFVLTFFSIPLLISDCCILWAQHFSVLANVSLLRQFPLILSLVLPSFVIATVTTGLAQYVLAWFLLLLGLLAETLLLHPIGSISVDISVPEASTGGGIDLTLLLTVGVAAIIWQYTKRRTAIARVALIISAFALIPILTALPSSHRPTFIAYSDKTPRRVDPAKLDMAYNLRNTSPCSTEFSAPSGVVRIALPLQIGNLPSETALLGFAEFQITAPHFSFPERGTHAYCQLERSNDSYCQIIHLEASKFERIKAQPVALHTTFYLTAVTNRPTWRFPAQTKTMAIPDVGSCQTYIEYDQGPDLLCRTGVRLPEATLVTIEHPGFHSKPVQIGNFHSDHESVGGLSPVDKWVTYLGGSADSPAQIRNALLHPGAELVFTPQRPLGHGIKMIEAQNLNLTPYSSIR